MNSKTFKYALKAVAVILTAFLLNRCSPFDEPYQPIEGNLKLHLYEKLDSTKRQIYLIVESERLYDCENYGFEFDSKIDGDLLTVDFKRIFTPNLCISGRGPAVATFNLTSLADSVYKIHLKMPNFSREGYIEKHNDSYAFVMDDTAPMLITDKEIKRVPDNVVWGMLEYDKPLSVAYVDTFYMYMEQYGAVQNTYADGEYNFFQVNDSMILNPGSDQYKFSNAFLMDYDGDFNLLVNLANYINYMNDDIHIRIASDKPNYISVP